MWKFMEIKSINNLTDTIALRKYFIFITPPRTNFTVKYSIFYIIGMHKNNK
jgi:hypothetical protein